MIKYILLAAVVGIASVRAVIDYKHKQKVVLYVNKVGPYSNTHETYHYYQLPVCRPENIVHKSLSLGEVLDGDRMAESLYEIEFQVTKEKTPLCKPYTLDAKALALLKEAIEEGYYFEFVFDDLPIRNFVGRLDEEGLFPHEHKIFLYTHHHFIIEFNSGNIVSAKVQVDRATPMSLHDKEPNSAQVAFTYSVEWIQTKAVRGSGVAGGGASDEFFPKAFEIHWLSVINSTLLVFLLVAFVVLLLVRVVRNDLIRYNEGGGRGGVGVGEKFDDDSSLLDNGWKVVSTDVFRFPPNKNLFSAVLGVGFQFITIIVTILVAGSLNIINVHRHGLINQIAVALYALTSCIAGFVSAKMYRQLGGVNWVWNINLTSALFSFPLFVVWCLENTISWIYQSTQALPFTTIILLFLVWLCVGYPLTVLGGMMGKNLAGRYEAPCRTRNIPRELPTLPFYHSIACFCVVGGFLPFSAISVELYYIFATVWGHETYTLFYILLIMLVILLVVTACVSVGLTYFQLSHEDYRWWWRSVFVGGSTGFFVFVYSLFFFLRRSEMSGLLQTVQYFGYVGLICYAFFLALGTVSFFASQKFVLFIFRSVKAD